MHTKKLFEHFSPIIQALSPAELGGAPSLNQKMQIATDGALQVCYAPLGFVNAQARLVIVGITPGKTQMLNAIGEARAQLDRGADADTALRAAKKTGAFSGAMRAGLIDLLDAVGLAPWLGIRSCDALFAASSHLVHTTSALHNPVFINGKNYNGTPDMLRHPLLREQLLAGLGADVQALSPQAVYLPLGGKATAALEFLATRGLLDPTRILAGLPHPSPANAERIAYFLGRKARDKLSLKTDPDKLDRARDAVVKRIAALA
jgi:hypothetical protein